jgi:hypothetical protein
MLVALLLLAPIGSKDVRPILSDKCFACHGADAKAKNIPLRLDVEKEAKARDRAGQSGGERLIKRHSPTGAPHTAGVHGHQLTDKEIATRRMDRAGRAVAGALVVYSAGSIGCATVRNTAWAFKR